MTLRFCSLASGSSGNCQYIGTDKINILIDAGLSGKKIQEGLKSIDVDPNSINVILVTHEHKDHIKGVGILSRRFNIPIYANSNTWKHMEKHIGNISDENIRIFDTEKDFNLGDLGISTFRTYHDASESVGFCINKKHKKISILTDTGCVDNNIKNKIKGSDLMLVESNHDIEMLKMGKYPWFLKKRIMGDQGHLSNEDAGNLITEVFCENKENILLAHLSNENNFPELAYQTVANIIADKGINIDKDISVGLTNRDCPTKVYNL